jgi:exopolysaccharide biosynthesis polyprenyl glycosylphosphotransferase
MPDRFIKRLFDIVFSLVIIIFICSWLFPIIALLIKLDSKGPVFFIQLRLGHDSRCFKCYKFRSMHINADADKRQATRNDRRITRVGAFLRKTSLDEFPQFFNVFKGEMSIVGPRPHMIVLNEKYAHLTPKLKERQSVKPGITGWAQVKGYRGETASAYSMIERIEADVWYLKNWSFGLDIKIIVRTLLITLKGDKNAF